MYTNGIFKKLISSDFSFPIFEIVRIKSFYWLREHSPKFSIFVETLIAGVSAFPHRETITYIYIYYKVLS